jgi:septal ring factor EnvC (AmiA/AmiB activator)
MASNLHEAIENFCGTAERYRSMFELAEQLRDLATVEARAEVAQQQLQKLKSVQADLAKAEERLKNYQVIADQIESASRAADERIAAKEAAITNAEGKLVSINQDIDAARAELADLKQEVVTTRAKLDAVIGGGR